MIPAWSDDTPDLIKQNYALQPDGSERKFFVRCICGECYRSEVMVSTLMRHLGCEAHCNHVNAVAAKA